LLTQRGELQNKLSCVTESLDAKHRITPLRSSVTQVHVTLCNVHNGHYNVCQANITPHDIHNENRNVTQVNVTLRKVHNANQHKHMLPV
jgi:hypothetical protein